MLIENFNGQGPYSSPGQKLTAVMGTAASFAAGLPSNYVGLALVNPATAAGAAPVKLVPLRAAFVGIGTGAGGPSLWGFAKYSSLTAAGTASISGATGFSGIITSPGTPGTSTGRAIVCGTFTLNNGTAGPAASNAGNWVQILGAAPLGTATAYQNALVTAELNGELSALPGEALVLVSAIGMSAQGSVTWVEVPLNSGA
jgi:hypothetical protein